jgi:hypothetical protein
VYIMDLIRSDVLPGNRAGTVMYWLLGSEFPSRKAFSGTNPGEIGRDSVLRLLTFSQMKRYWCGYKCALIDSYDNSQKEELWRKFWANILLPYNIWFSFPFDPILA